MPMTDFKLVDGTQCSLQMFDMEQVNKHTAMHLIRQNLNRMDSKKCTSQIQGHPERMRTVKRFSWTLNLKIVILTVSTPNQLFLAYFEVGLQASCN